MTCEQVVRSVWDYVDGAAPNELRTTIEAHLAVCRGWSGHLTFARTLLDRIGDTPVSEPELMQLRERVQSALRAEAAG